MAIYGLWGAGGFGRETMPLMRDWVSRVASSDSEAVFVVDDDYIEKKVINGYRVISATAFLAERQERYFNIAIAESSVRETIAIRAIKAGAKPLSFYAPTVRLVDQNEIGEGAILCDHVVITANAKIGKFFHANLYSYVAHDCVIGDYVTFAPRVSCNGGVIVEDYAYIGTGAVLRNGTAEKPIRIGKGAVIGMGAVVVESVPPHTTVIGNPAKPKK